jgi:hypothetical protein
LRDTWQRQPSDNRTAPQTVSGRERVSLADHARGVNWLSLSQGGSGKTGEPADSAVLLAKCAMALVGEAETGFRVWRAKLVREKSLRGI